MATYTIDPAFQWRAREKFISIDQSNELIILDEMITPRRYKDYQRVSPKSLE